MLRLITTITGTLALLTGAFVLATDGAHAAAGGNSKNVFTIEADCGGGDVGEVRVNLSSGEWAAAHPVGGGAFVPIAFGEEHGSFTDPDGNSFPIDEEGGAKGRSEHNAHDVVTCSFDIDVEFPDGSKLVLEGTVTGFFPGAH